VETEDGCSQHSPLLAKADMGRRLDYLHPAPLTLHKANSMSAAHSGGPHSANDTLSVPNTAVASMHHPRFDILSPPKTHVTPIIVPALVSTVSSPALMAISPQLG
ncbi:hypothetical protein GGI20_006177, partial [Coemansia sp. BCRC 34301]